MNKRASVHTRQTLPLIVIVISITALPAHLPAAPVQPQKARTLVTAWLTADPAPLAAPLGKKIARTRRIKDANAQTLYYAIDLDPEGFIIVAADDRIEPVIAFSQSGTFDPSPDNPLAAILDYDLAARMAALQTAKTAPAPAASQKWQRLTPDNMQTQFEITPLSVAAVTDIRVEPFLQTEWGQDTEYGDYCYNYYTPSHYPTGCVATGMAQLMRHNMYPTAAIGSHACGITVDGYPQTAWTMGGTGPGGAYQWSLMPEDPAPTISDPERQEIGRLCYDAGIAANMAYASSSSSASSYDAAQALVEIFDYGQAIYGQNYGSELGSVRNTMINPNLEARMPVMLSIRRTGGGHVVVADGYGYDYGTLYHHLNLGWEGSSNAWYALPVVDAGSYTYTSVDGCVYNVFKTGTGEIVSGRVTDIVGNPVPGVTVTAKIGSTTLKQSTTDTHGIYALINLSSNQIYTVTAEEYPYAFTPQIVTTGRSQMSQPVCGNKWQIDFASTAASPPIAYDQHLDALAGTAEPITLVALDDGYPDPPAQLTYTVMSLPRFGTLSEPGVGPITSAPFQLSPAAHTVDYLPCAYFSGSDSFAFATDDGGDPPSAGPSNTATVTIDVANQTEWTLAPDTDWVAHDPIDTYYVDSRQQSVYLASELGGPQTIIALALEFYEPPLLDLTRWTIRMQHTSLSGFTTSTPTPFWLTSGWATVYQADAPANPSGWRYFYFSQPFQYNGTDNLMIDFSFNNATWADDGGYCSIVETDPAYRSMTLKSDYGTNGDPLTWDFWALGGSYWPAQNVPNIRLISAVTADPIPGDLDKSCSVDFYDLARMGIAWRTTIVDPDYDDECDIAVPKNVTIDPHDLAALAQSWLLTYSP